jgi:hypothetical protein
MQTQLNVSKRAWTAPKLQRLQVQQAEGAGSKPGDGGPDKKS